jgi:rod shape-determining protein MreC
MDRRPERQIVLMAIVLLGMTGLAVRQVRTPAIIEDSVGRVVTPVQRVLTGAAGAAGGAIGGLRSLATLREKNRELEERVSTLEVETTKLEELKRENRQLRDELAFQRERVDLSLTGASVVGHTIAAEPGSLMHTIKIDVGAKDALASGMPVACSRGLVGVVEHTGPYWSDVRLITDPSSAVWGRIQRSRATGVVFGSPSGELRIRFVPQNSSETERNIVEGDLVYTSGLSARFPPRILIGQVIQVFQSDEKTHQEAIVRPSVNFNALELVLVVNQWLPATETDTGDEPRTDQP